jgi:hypothetical protein
VTVALTSDRRSCSRDRSRDLAHRAGARLPSVDTLATLLDLMGERLVLAGEPIDRTGPAG